MDAADRVERLVNSLVGPASPVRFELPGGRAVGPPDAPMTVVVHPDAIRRIATAPGELGLARAYVAGDIEVDGSIADVLAMRDRLPEVRLGLARWWDAVRAVGISGLRPLPPPPEEVVLHGRRHTEGRDAAAIAHHYDVSNRFYELVLGPSMTYSCGVWLDPAAGLEQAQGTKHELVCQKLALRPGMRLLDVGCGWGSLVRHAARQHGVQAVGVTISHQQAEWARDAVEREGLADLVEIRLQDYRDVADGPFDAISSIGMFEHVGTARLAEYFSQLHGLAAPGARVLNHAISRPPGQRSALARRGFADRYVFPDGELVELGSVVTAMQSTGIEVRHLESLREHYALTLQAWCGNLEEHWDEAVAQVGAGRARVWRLYMAGSGQGFTAGRLGVNQVLGVRCDTRGRSRFPLRPDWAAGPVPPTTEPDSGAARDEAPRRRAATVTADA